MADIMADAISTDGPKLTFVGKLFVLLVIAGSFYGAYYLFFQGPKVRIAGLHAGADRHARSGSSLRNARAAERVEIGVAYGTEKKTVAEEAVDRFAKTPQGATIKVNLITIGSLEGAR